MLEDKTDNLQNADGDLENIQQEVQVAENADVSEIVQNETTESAIEIVSTETPLEVKEETKAVNMSNDAVDSISNSNAEESEDETIRHEIPMADYNTLSMEELVAENVGDWFQHALWIEGNSNQ